MSELKKPATATTTVSPFDGLSPLVIPPGVSSDRQTAINFWDALKIVGGDNVIMVSLPINLEIGEELRRRHANLTLVAYDERHIAPEEKRLRRIFPESSGKLASRVGDFGKMPFDHDAKVVFAPLVLDDPEATNRAGIVQKMCELTKNGGYVLASFGYDEKENHQFVETTSKAAGYNLEFLGLLAYGDAHRAHVWRCGVHNDTEDLDLQVADKFLQDLGIGRGDTVATIGIGNPSIVAAALRRGAHLIIREYNQDLIHELKIAAARDISPGVEADIQVGDFNRIEPPRKVKLVWYPHILDDPRIKPEARQALILTACRLTQHGGLIAASLDGVKINPKDIEKTASANGYSLRHLGEFQYESGLGDFAHCWRCTAK